jgi:hypothetical protein
MGHADIAMTMRYAHPTPESKRKAVELLTKTNQVADAVADGDFPRMTASGKPLKNNGGGNRIRTRR